MTQESCENSNTNKIGEKDETEKYLIGEKDKTEEFLNVLQPLGRLFAGWGYKINVIPGFNKIRFDHQRKVINYGEVLFKPQLAFLMKKLRDLKQERGYPLNCFLLKYQFY